MADGRNPSAEKNSSIQAAFCIFAADGSPGNIISSILLISFMPVIDPIFQVKSELGILIETNEYAIRQLKTTIVSGDILKSYKWVYLIVSF